jgi:peptidyl-prolyl cis-trans isomerase SurA
MFNGLKLQRMKNMFRITRALLLPALLLAPLSASPAQDVVRVAAVVNEEEITVTDLISRTDLVIFSSGLPDTQEIRQRTMRQVLQTLIDESLQLQEAKAMGVKVKDSEIEAQLKNIARENSLAAGELAVFLARRGVNIEALKAQIGTALAWGSVVRERLQSQIEIGNEEIDEAMQLIETNRNKPRQLVSQIFLAVDDPSKEEQVRRSANRIVQQIRNGGNFGALARAFSQSSTAAVGGDLGWLIQGQMEEAVERTLATMQPGTLAGPIRAVSGYYILLLRDRRQPGGGQPDQVTVDLKQIVMPLPAEATEEEIRAVMAAAQAIRESISDCRQIGDIGAMPGQPEVIDIGTVRVGELAAQLQPVVMGLAPGQISAPLRGQSSIAMLMVCQRSALEEKLPDREEVRERLIRGKVDLLARRYLRDLRRAAFIDIRAWSVSQ